MLRKWTHPKTDEVRYYVSTTYPIPFLSNSDQRGIAGRWIAKDHNGNARFFERGQTGPCYGEDGRHYDERFQLQGMTFERFEELFNSSLTKGGNFSWRRYFSQVAG
jgi:hypothetical protein